MLFGRVTILPSFTSMSLDCFKGRLLCNNGQDDITRSRCHVEPAQKKKTQHSVNTTDLSHIASTCLHLLLSSGDVWPDGCQTSDPQSESRLQLKIRGKPEKFAFALNQDLNTELSKDGTENEA